MYNNQSNQIKSILSKYWFLLQSDPIVSKYISSIPSVTFRRATSLKDQLTKSHFELLNKIHCKYRGTFPCGSCTQCPYLDTRKQIMLPNGQKWKSSHFVNCRRQGIIYMFICSCNAFYIGKTIREFRARMQEHITAANIGDLYSPTGKHMAVVSKSQQ